MSDAPSETCELCGGSIPDGVPGGACPSCLIASCLNGGWDDATDLEDETAIPGNDNDSISSKTEESSEWIGRYRILRTLGEGGMGIVYLAEQTEPVVRKVALKVIKLGMDTHDVIKRFDAERQALAVMNHPGIAQVLDAGATETGRPYFVMERVDGVPLTEFCHLHKLNLEARLKVFAEICAAVQHAHQKGIAHRDLKPSNILVGLNDANEPLVKIIDFGIAKAVVPDLTDVDLAETMGHRVMGTPAYMSPEQAGAIFHDVDMRSDIYSLGVVLYELLTGKLPFADRAELANREEHLRLLREEDPRLPSSHAKASLGTAYVSPKQLKGDLDWIVLKALERQPDRRYASTSEFAQDILRHRHHEPILAGQPSPWYRLGKFARKHRFGLSAAAAMVVLLIAGVVVSSWQAIRAVKAEQATAARLAAGEEVLRFVLDDLSRELKALGRLEILGSTTEEVYRFYDAIPTELQTVESRRIRAEALMNIGRVRSSRGEATEAESAFTDAKDIYEELINSGNSSSRVRDGLGAVMTLLGDHFVSLTQFDQAAEANAQALTIYQNLRKDEPAAEEWVSGEAAAWLGIADLHYEQQNYAQAELDIRQALSLWQSLSEHHPEDARLTQKLAKAHQSLGVSLRHLERPAEAEAAFGEALQLWSFLVETVPGDHAPILTGKAETLNNAAAFMHAAGKLDQAAAYTEEAVGLRQQLYQRDPGNVDWLYQLGIVEQNLGVVLNSQMRYQEAIVSFESAFKRWETIRAMDPPLLNWRQYWTQGVSSANSAYRQLWNQALEESDAGKAIAMANKCLSLSLEFLADSPTDSERRLRAARVALDVTATFGRYQQLNDAQPSYQLARYLLHSLGEGTQGATNERSRLHKMGVALKDPNPDQPLPDPTVLAELSLPATLRAELENME